MANERIVEKSSYTKLKNLILDRKIKHGQRMTEAFLSEKMELSRIPVREAIQLLVHEGFIERTGKNGYMIKEYNEQDIIDLYSYREAMDGMLARLFTQRMDLSQLYFLEMNIEHMHEQLKEEVDHAAFSKTDLDFHRYIARGARNKYMEHQHEIILEKVLFIADSIYETGKEGAKMLLDEHSYEETYNQHQEIYTAIKNRDLDGAEAAARGSVRNGLRKALMALSRMS
jgi:DNA-binding GntR family transcriptional regulator